MINFIISWKLESLKLAGSPERSPVSIASTLDRELEPVMMSQIKCEMYVNAARKQA